MRTTALGYPVISDDLHDKIFGVADKPQEMGRLQKQKAEKLLGSFEINTPVDYPSNLYDGSLPVPSLQGHDLRDHFENIAKAQVGQYKTWADSFSKATLPPIPTPAEFVFEAG